MRILKRVKRRQHRFFQPLRDFFGRMYHSILEHHVLNIKSSVVSTVVGIKETFFPSKKSQQTFNIKNYVKNVHDNKKAWCTLLNVVMPLVAVFALLQTVQYWNNVNYGLNLIWNGQAIGTIADESAYEKASEMFSQRMVYDTAVSTKVHTAPKFVLAMTDTSRYDAPAHICDCMIRKSDKIIEEATGLYINGRLAGTVKSSADMRFLLQDMLRTQKIQQKADSADFVENVETVTGLFPTISILSPHDLYLRLTEKTPMLNIRIIKSETYNESVDYKTITKKNNSQYTDYSKIIKEGKSGTRKCIDEVSYINGKEMGRSHVSSQVTVQPVNKILEVGTRHRPTGKIPGEASGKLMWPVPSIHNITSYYEHRWGRMHWGIDISGGNSYGRTIVAADGGTVEYVRIQEYGYGHHLLINHGNGYCTLYAHTSRILVSPGQKVAKGQPIAQIGSTGDSTGAHLHFEVHLNGTKVNPLSYVKQ